MGGQGKPRRYFREREAVWAGVEGKRKHGLQRACPARVKRQQNQFGCKEASGKPRSFSCKMSVDLPKIKFHILWAKDYFLFQG